MMVTGQIVESPMAPRMLEWNRLGDEFNRQSRKPYNEQISNFEDRLTEYLSCGFALALNSGTAALHLALQVVGVGPGEKVICSDFTFVASANPIKYLGADPVFIDSEPDTWNMDPTLLELAIKELIEKNQKPKAIVVVHIYGNPARIGPINEIANFYRIPLLEDAAQSFGSTYSNLKVGTFGTLGVYSFNNNKIFSTLGGGALVSRDKSLIDRAKFLASQAKEPSDHYCHKVVGYNYMMSPVNACLGYAGLPLVDGYIKKCRNIFDEYKKTLGSMGKMYFQGEANKAISNRWLSVVKTDSKEKRILVQDKLSVLGFGASRLWRPLSTQALYRGCSAFNNGVSEQLFKEGICLPSGPNITRDQLELVTNVVEKTLRR